MNAPFIPVETLVINARGLAFAAFGSADQIGRMLGLDPGETERFQARARSHFFTMMATARRTP